MVALGEAGAGRAQPDAHPDRQPAAQALGQRQHVRAHPGGLVREPRSGAADSALDLVQHEQGPGRVAGLPRGEQVALGGRHHAALAQAGLEEHGRHVRAHRRAQRRRVAVGDKPDGQAERAERGAD